MRRCSSVATAAVLAAVWLASSGRCEEIHLEIEGLPEGATVSAFVAGQESVAAAQDGGVWKLTGLTPGTYNIEIRAGGLHIIGVDLRLRDADGNPVETAPVGEAVETTIREFFEHTEDFFDERRMPLVAGAGDRAVGLIENVRRGDTTT
ncbi:MAG: peptidase associated/transthyretin-like domain-containing protein, partial [Planctomycetota bacterium]